ncbi:MAG: Asp-tRNA(Asn)/Glu-tRNA(Gln) amidotransferase subunit GatC [Akkermansiaceae bacterium]|nr:Asp-tRNA(Asn)/Glu-tRNA(Gln) amidotransferase subunit GatC [Akkermansiaceae bacterium]
MDVGYVAALARLELSEDEKERFQQQLVSILAFVETLSGIDVEGVEPTAHPAPVLDCFREDAAVQGLEREDFLRNAPDSALEQIRVPKVVEA